MFLPSQVTIIFTLSVVTQPPLFSTLMVYIVVETGDAIGDRQSVHESPNEGDQLIESISSEPIPLIWYEVPIGIVIGLGPISIVGYLNTVTVTG